MVGSPIEQYAYSFSNIANGINFSNVGAATPFAMAALLIGGLIYLSYNIWCLKNGY